MQSKYSRKLNNWKEDSTKKDSLKKEGVKMAVYKETIMLKSHGKTPTYVNITPQVREAIRKKRNPEWNLHSNFSTYNMFSIF